MIERVLEPEVMDDPAESQIYDEMDHAAVNALFVKDLLACGNLGNEVLDLGTGTARIPIELCRHHEDCRVLASDAAVSMLEIAKINVAIEGFEHRILLHHGDSKDLTFDDAMFGTVMSNSLIHHLPDPIEAVREMVRLVEAGGLLFVRDLMRPSDQETLDHLVTQYAGEESETARQLFHQSLYAALTLEEIRALVESVGFEAESVTATSDRHWTWQARKPE